MSIVTPVRPHPSPKHTLQVHTQYWATQSCHIVCLEGIPGMLSAHFITWSIGPIPLPCNNLIWYTSVYKLYRILGWVRQTWESKSLPQDCIVMQTNTQSSIPLAKIITPYCLKPIYLIILNHNRYWIIRLCYSHVQTLIIITGNLYVFIKYNDIYPASV